MECVLKGGHRTTKSSSLYSQYYHYRHHHHYLTEKEGCAVVIRAVRTETFSREFLYHFDARCLQIRTIWIVNAFTHLPFLFQKENLS